MQNKKFVTYTDYQPPVCAHCRGPIPGKRMTRTTFRYYCSKTCEDAYRQKSVEGRKERVDKFMAKAKTKHAEKL